MIVAQIFDLTEEYISRRTEKSVQCIRARGKTADGFPVSVLISDIPHEIFIDADDADQDLDRLFHRLDEALLKRPHPCRRTDCPNNCRPPERSFGPSYESCLLDRKTDREAVSSYDIVERRGFEVYEETKRSFIRFILTRSYYASAARNFFESRDWDVYECVKDCVQSFVQLKNFAGFEWYEWPQGSPVVSFHQFNESKLPWKMAPFRKVVFDIETIAVKYNDEDSEKALYPIGCICADDGAIRSVYYFGGPVEGFVEPTEDRTTQLVHFDTELDMLKAFKRDWIETADFLSGWDSDRFDIKTVFMRGTVLGDDTFCRFSDGRVVRFVKDEKMGDTKVYCPGLVCLDYKKVVEKDTRTRPYDYKLKTIAQLHDLGEKGDLPYSELYRSFYGSPKQRGELLSYCAQDVELTKRIGDKIGAFTKLVAKARVKRILPRDEMHRGAAFCSSRKVKEYLQGEFLMMNWRETYIDGEKKRVLCNALKKVEGYEEKVHEKPYTGGFVRDPVAGIYRNFQVGTLDFNSLYPSIVRTRNMCRSTQLFSANQLPPDKTWTSSLGFSFAQHREGVYPRIMREMVDKRNEVRKKMKSITDPDELEQMEAYQTELKIVANGLYGLMGADTSDLVLKSAAASTCAQGAELAKKACEVICSHPEFVDVMGLSVVYGDTDSLMIRFSKSESAEQTFEWLKRVSHYVNIESGILEGGILKMGMEDVSSMALVGKKMYVKLARTIEDGELKKPKLKISGMDNRSKSPFVRENVRKMFDSALREGIDITKTYEDTIRLVASGTVNPKLFLHTSKINKPLENYANEAHAVAARQLVAAGQSVRIGDRVGYYRVCLTGSEKNKKATTVVADYFLSEYHLDWKAYVRETIDAMAPLAGLIREYSKLSDPRNYPTKSSIRLAPPPQLSWGDVGVKKRVRPAQSGGPLDAFVDRAKKTARRPTVREFDEF